MKKILFAILCISCSLYTMQSQDLFYDTVHAQTKKMDLAGQKKCIIPINIPLGTQELVYRITVTDAGGTITKSLSSILSSIPDARTKLISGGLDLINGISGNNKCSYAIVSSKQYADAFIAQKSYKYCIKKDNIIEDGNYLNATNACLKENKTTIYFAIKSENWIEKQTIHIEVIPYVNKHLADGWNKLNKQQLIDKCLANNTSSTNKIELCNCVLNTTIQKYTYPSYQELTVVEKTDYFNKIQKSCSTATINNDDILLKLQEDANAYFQNQDYANAINSFIELIQNNKKSISNYQKLTKSYLLTKQYSKALEYIKPTLEKDNNNLESQLLYAHCLLFNNNFYDAKLIYQKYTKQNINATTSWTQGIINDISLFRTLGIEHYKFDKIISLIK